MQIKGASSVDDLHCPSRFRADHARSIKVSTKLRLSKKLLRTNITVEAYDAVIMRNGNVLSKELIAEAARTAKQVEGVRSVKSCLKVGPTDTADGNASS